MKKIKWLFLLMPLAMLLASCEDSDDNGGPGNEFPGQEIVTGYNLPFEVYAGTDVEFEMTGFTTECELIFSNQTRADHKMYVKEIAVNNILVAIPAGFGGNYEVYVARGPARQHLGIIWVINEGGGVGGNIPTLAFADIANATTLFTVSKKSSFSPNSARSEDEPDVPMQEVLYKITEDDIEEEVRFMGEDGTSIDYMDIRLIKNMSDRYVYMLYETITHIDTVTNWEGDKIVHQLYPTFGIFSTVIDKSDGSAFKLDMEEVYIYEDTSFQSDRDGNVYFASGTSNSIWKLHTSDGNAYVETVNGGNGYYPYWVVDQAGNIIINNEYTRLAAGGFTRSNIRSSEEPFICYNDDEGFYRFDYAIDQDENGNYDYYDALYYAVPQSPILEWEERFPLFKGTDEEWSNHDFKSFCYRDHTLLMGYAYGDDTENFRNIKITIRSRDDITMEFLPAYVMPEGIEFHQYGNKFPHTGEYLYGMNSTGIWRMKILTGEVELHFSDYALYDIKWMRVYDDIITFSAFDLSTGDTVLMQVDKDGQPSVLESRNGDRIIQLERIN